MNKIVKFSDELLQQYFTDVQYRDYLVYYYCYFTASLFNKIQNHNLPLRSALKEFKAATELLYDYIIAGKPADFSAANKAFLYEIRKAVRLKFGETSRECKNMQNYCPRLKDVLIEVEALPEELRSIFRIVVIHVVSGALGNYIYDEKMDSEGWIKLESMIRDKLKEKGKLEAISYFDYLLHCKRILSKNDTVINN